MSSFQRTNLHNAKKPSVNQSMESQILSMLKGVIMDENPMVDYSELEENIFDDNSYDSSQEEEEIPFRFNESDIDQTSFNKSSFFKREQTQKSQTTKATQQPLPICPYNNEAHRRLMHKKFQTQSLKPEELNLISNNNNLITNINSLNLSLNSCSSQQPITNNPFFVNPYQQYNQIAFVQPTNYPTSQQQTNNTSNYSISTLSSSLMKNQSGFYYQTMNNLNISKGNASINVNKSNNCKLMPLNKNALCNNSINTNIPIANTCNNVNNISFSSNNLNTTANINSSINSHNANLTPINKNVFNYNMQTGPMNTSQKAVNLCDSMVNNNYLCNKIPHLANNNNNNSVNNMISIQHELTRIKQNNINSNNNIINTNKELVIATDDPIAIELEYMLIEANNCFSSDVFSKLEGKFTSLLKQQQPSRVCQHYIENTNIEIIHLILLEILEPLPQLLFDPYANYFCLKLFHFISPSDRILYLKYISPYLIGLSLNKIATYPIQTIIEQVNTPQEKEIVFNALCNNLLKLSLDIYGTHVLERILTYFEYNLVRPIITFILENFMTLACNPNGLCLVKKIIILGYKKEIFPKIQNELIKNALTLIQNPYGNYALQTALEHWELIDLKDIIKMFYNKNSIFASQKFSSNVIEKCIEKSEEFLNNFIEELVSNQNTISILMTNTYGNYVMQTALKITKNETNQKKIISAIEANLPKLTDKKLINKWRSIVSVYPEFSTIIL